MAVAEGFAQDGSTDPGAKVFVTNDGKNFTLAHSESTTGQESLMAAKMLSKSEHWAGGTTQSGGLAAPLLALTRPTAARRGRTRTTASRAR